MLRVAGASSSCPAAHDVEHDAAPARSWAHPCLTTTSCATRSPPPASWRWSAGLVGYFLVLRGADLRRPRAGPCRLHRRNRRGADRRAAALGAGCNNGGRRGRHGAARRAARAGATWRSASCWRCRSASGCCSCISSPPMRPQATALLFGNVLGVDRRNASGRCWARPSLCLCGLAVIARPLLFASLQPELAEAKGVSLRLVSVLFLAIVALATAEMRPDRRRAAGLRADGGAGGGGRSGSRPAGRPRRRAGRRRWRWPRPGPAWRWPSTPTGRPASGLPR